jgi:hypothetical protein
MFFWDKCVVSLLEPREVVAYSLNSEAGGVGHAHQANLSDRSRAPGAGADHGVTIRIKRFEGIRRQLRARAMFRQGDTGSSSEVTAPTYLQPPFKSSPLSRVVEQLC